ncbi:hypothetical protein BCS98_04930 [Vibrio breoganii]|nr:hypothetical protein BCS98_04930 [Vibrio breoganii]
MIFSVTAFASLFNDLGLSTASIQKEKLSSAQSVNLFWLNLIIGAILTSIILLVSPVISNFYGRIELTNPLMLMSLLFIFTAVGAQSEARLIRNMHFGLSAISKICGLIITLVISVCLAYYGFSYWSIVIGEIIGAMITSILLVYFSPFRIKLPQRSVDIKSLINFGFDVSLFNMVNYFSRNLDNILIGKFTSVVTLGYYSRAYQLLLFPIHAIRQPINMVAFPAMCRLSPQSPEYTSYYIKLIRIISLVTMPTMAFIHVSSHEIIILVLGNDWSDVVPFVSILTLAGFIQPISSMRGLIALSSGDSKLYLYSGVITAIIVSIGFIFGINWGALGVAWSYVLSEWLLFIPMQIYVSRKTKIRITDIMTACSIPLLSSILFIVIHYLVFSELKTGLVMLDLSLMMLTTICCVFICLFCDRKTRMVFFDIKKVVGKLVRRKQSMDI